MSEITAKPASTAAEKAARREHNRAVQADNLKFVMWLYLASEVIIFGILIAAYAQFRFYNPELVREIQADMSIGLVGLNTFLLLTSSWSMVMGLLAIQKNNRQGLIRWFALTAILGAVFVGLQYVEYQELASHGVTLYAYDVPGAPGEEAAADPLGGTDMTNPDVAPGDIQTSQERSEEASAIATDAAEAPWEFGQRFYPVTFFHGLHVVIGVLLALRIMALARRGRYDNGNYVHVEVFGLYWHFVDVVWIILFALIYLV